MEELMNVVAKCKCVCRYESTIQSRSMWFFSCILQPRPNSRQWKDGYTVTNTCLVVVAAVAVVFCVDTNRQFYVFHWFSLDYRDDSTRLYGRHGIVDSS